MRYTHLPTGVAAESRSERSQHKNDANALALLKAKLIRLRGGEARGRVRQEVRREGRDQLRQPDPLLRPPAVPARQGPADRPRGRQPPRGARRRHRRLHRGVPADEAGQGVSLAWPGQGQTRHGRKEQSKGMAGSDFTCDQTDERLSIQRPGLDRRRSTAPAIAGRTRCGSARLITGLPRSSARWRASPSVTIPRGSSARSIKSSSAMSPPATGSTVFACS